MRSSIVKVEHRDQRPEDHFNPEDWDDDEDSWRDDDDGWIDFNDDFTAVNAFRLILEVARQQGHLFRLNFQHHHHHPHPHPPNHVPEVIDLTTDEEVVPHFAYVNRNNFEAPPPPQIPVISPPTRTHTRNETRSARVQPTRGPRVPRNVTSRRVQRNPAARGPITRSRSLFGDERHY